MSLFINPENQNILWEMINKVPLCNIVFPQGSQKSKNNWFKNIIQEYYTILPPTISRNDLYSLNREVLSKMINSLNELCANLQKNQTLSTQIDRGVFSRNQNTTEILQSKKQINQSQEYKPLFEESKPQQIDFSEKLDDEVITNMDELIENHKKMRDQELQQVASLYPQPPLNNSQNIKVSILEDVPKETIQSVLLDQKNIVNKQVSFDMINIIYKDVMELHKKIENLDKKIDIFLDKFSYNQIQVDNNTIYNNNINDINNVSIIKQIMEKQPE